MTGALQTDFVTGHADLATAIGRLDKWTAYRLRERRLPGVAVGLVHRGELIWGKGYGVADMEQQTPMTLDTRFRIASITKTFTGVATMQLRDAGKLRLDDPVSQYLDWFDLRYPGAPAITIRHLLTHTSGLPRDATVPHWTEHIFQSWAEVVETTKQRQPVLPPRQEFGYSNLGYTLLGGVIEAASGERWADYIQQHILDPLQMTNTVAAPDGSEANLATGYFMPDDNGVRQPAPFIPTNGFSPSASMASSVNDLVKYMRFHLGTDDSPVLNGHTLREMHTVDWLYKDWSGGYGAGIGLYRIGDWTISGHSGGYNGYLTQFTLCRDHAAGVIVLTNCIGSDPFSFVEQAYKLVLPELIKIDAPKPAEPKADWQPFVGTYVDKWSEIEVVVRGGQLQVVSVQWMNEPPVILEPTDDPAVFTIKEPNGTRETARFERNEAGEVTRVWLRNEYLRRKL